jgi:hypothetical protein
MIDAQRLVGFLFADRAHAALLREHALVLLERNPVSGLEQDPAHFSLLMDACVLARIERHMRTARWRGEGQLAGRRILSIAHRLSMPLPASFVARNHGDTAPAATLGSQFAMAGRPAATRPRRMASGRAKKTVRHGGRTAMSRRSGHDRERVRAASAHEVFAHVLTGKPVPTFPGHAIFADVAIEKLARFRTYFGNACDNRRTQNSEPAAGKTLARAEWAIQTHFRFVAESYLCCVT